MSFSGDIKKFTSKTERATLFVFRGTALGLFSKVILRTPVDTGRLRANWQINLNSPASGTVGGSDKSGGKAISKANNGTGKAKITDSIYLINNLPYAKVIENGSSTQAPQGMVKVTVTEFQREVEKNVRKARK